MVLHRPVELAAFTGEVGSSASIARLGEAGSSCRFFVDEKGPQRGLGAFILL